VLGVLRRLLAHPGLRGGAFFRLPRLARQPGVLGIDAGLGSISGDPALARGSLLGGFAARPLLSRWKKS
jgi:hypothetical protein